MFYGWIVEKAFSNITEADHQALKDNADMLMNNLLSSKQLLMRDTVVTPESNKSMIKKKGRLSFAEIREMSPKIVSVQNEFLTSETLKLLEKYQAALEAIDTGLYVKSIITIIKVADYNPKPEGKRGYFFSQLRKLAHVAEANASMAARAYIKILYSHSRISGDNSVDFNDELLENCINGLKNLAEKSSSNSDNIVKDFHEVVIADIWSERSYDEVPKLFCRVSFNISEYLKDRKPEEAAKFAALAIKIDYSDERRAQAFEVLKELSATAPNAVAIELIDLATPENEAGIKLIGKAHDLLRTLIEEDKISEDNKDEIIRKAAEKGVLRHSSKEIKVKKSKIEIS